MSMDPRAQGGGSGVQQRFQPRQTDDESSLLELEVVENQWGATIDSAMMVK